jgi:curved DNA-binding protein CbpA
VLWLRPGAPWPVVKAVYRSLAAVHHPDRGGDPVKMQEINAAYAVLRRASSDA